MANTIRIKRSASTNTPGSLTQGELANSESGSPNGINELFIGTTGPSVTKIIRNMNGAPSEPTAGLANGTLDLANDYFPFEDVTDSNPYRATFATLFTNAVVEGTGITVSGAAGVRTVAVDYLGTDNFIDSATNLEGTAIATGDTIVYHDATDNNVKKGFVSDLPFLTSYTETQTLNDVVTLGATTAIATTFSGGINMADSDLNRPVLEDYGVKHQAPTVSTNAVTVDCTLGNSVLIDMDPATADVTLTLSNPPASGTYGEVNLMIVMGTPAYDITWPGSVTWMNGGGAPVLTSTNNVVDLIHLFTVDGGTTWYGTYSLASAGSGGTVTSVGTGIGLTGGPITGSGTIDMDFSTLTDMTADISGTTEFILQDSTTESRKAASEISLSVMNNDIQNIMGTYAFSSTITAGDPGAGTIRFNSATPASVTALYIDDLEDNGNDWGWILSNLATNDILVIKSHVDAADYLIVQLSGATTDNTGYWTVPVTVLFSGTLPTATDLLNIEVQWFSQGTAGTVTSVTAGTGLINSGTATAVVLDFDFSELTDMTGDITGSTEFILQDGTTESRKAAGEIDVGFFDFSGLVDTAVTTSDYLVVTDQSNSEQAIKRAMSNIDLSLFNNTTSDFATTTYVDNAVASEMTYKGAYNASTNTPPLDTGTPTINVGDMYYVSVAGTFFTESVVPGDVLIANTNSTDAAALADWDIIEGMQTVPDASETVKGIIEIATQAEVDAASSTVLAVVPSYLHNTTFDGGTF